MTIKLSCGVVDLSGLPDEIRYGPTIGVVGEYRRVLNMATDAGWRWVSGALPGFVAIARLGGVPVSVRVVRWDTGREAEVPEDALRWGPDTKLGTCRAELLRRPGLRADVALIGDVPYVLPFSGAKWAVRVTLGEELQVAAVLPHGAKVRAFAFPGSGAAGRAPFGFLSDRAFLEHCDTPREKLGALLDAAGDALRAEKGGETRAPSVRAVPITLRVPFPDPAGGFGEVALRGWREPNGAEFVDPADLAAWRGKDFEARSHGLGDRLRTQNERPNASGAGRFVPDDTALSLLAECLDECLFPVGLSRRVRLFLERATFPQEGRSRLQEAQELLALVLDCELTAPAGSYAFIQPDILRAEICAFLKRETAAEIRREWKGAGRG